jgi:hypothetical protein
MLINSIEIVFPIGSMWWLPYLRNSCLGIVRQDYPAHKTGITVSYLSKDPSEQIGGLAMLCKEFNAVLVSGCGKAEAFETPLCRNMGGIRAARDFVAFIDCDVVLHPSTFEIAAGILSKKCGAVIPVADVNLTPDNDFFTDENIGRKWDDIVKHHARARPDALGAVIVPRRAVHEIRGYDERMFGWGADDTDFVMRLRRYGIKMENLLQHGCAFALHQSHPTGSRESKFTMRNRDILSKSGNVVRNGNSWGGVVDGYILSNG